MVTLVNQCPHEDCLTERMRFELRAVSYAPGAHPQEVRNFVHASCGACAQPVAFEVATEGGRGRLGPDFEQYPYGLEQLGWHVVRIWPEVPGPDVPDFLPDQVARAFLSAERNFMQRDMEEAAAASYGRALDIGTKMFAPDLGASTLYNRIKRLAEQNRITADLAAWANSIRLIRNDALHEIDQIDRDQLVAIRGFTEMVLTYIFTLPGMLAERQRQTKQKP